MSPPYACLRHLLRPTTGWAAINTLAIITSTLHPPLADGGDGAVIVDAILSPPRMASQVLVVALPLSPPS